MVYQFQNNAASPTATTFTVQSVVENNQLVVGFNRTNPGVFTAGTPIEGTASNPRNDATP